MVYEEVERFECDLSASPITSRASSVHKASSSASPQSVRLHQLQMCETRGGASGCPVPVHGDGLVIGLVLTAFVRFERCINQNSSLNLLSILCFISQKITECAKLPSFRV